MCLCVCSCVCVCLHVFVCVCVACSGASARTYACVHLMQEAHAAGHVAKEPEGRLGPQRERPILQHVPQATRTTFNRATSRANTTITTTTLRTTATTAHTLMHTQFRVCAHTRVCACYVSVNICVYAFVRAFHLPNSISSITRPTAPHGPSALHVWMYVCVCVSIRACLRPCVRASEHAYVRYCMRV